MSEADPKVQAKAAAKVKAETAAPAAPEHAVEKERKKRPWRLILMLSVPLILLAIGGYMWLTSGRYVSTDNAYVQQDMVSVASEVNGIITEVLVHENQRVHRGDVLFRIDPRPYRIALANAEAQIANAEVQVNQLEARSSGTVADIQGAEANLTYQQREFARLQELMRRGWITRTRFDEANHNVQEARERLSNARAASVTAQSALRGGGASNQPAVEAARVARDQALLNLSRTEVRAPADGVISQTHRLQAGATAVTGVPMVTLVRNGTTYVEANYKETDLANMYVGQPAEIKIDAYPGVHIVGHVASIGAGTGSQFSVLPAQNASGNWVKVRQRVPVRIAIDGDPGRPMLAGLSAEIIVDTQNRPAQPPPRPQQQATR